ncbi:hypothetical protein BC835DRAFT_296067 [Cytidiella melzeri]|nr:hypothetical protein BC835DRAFT_296067 [Cytidiella melzeri]
MPEWSRARRNAFEKDFKDTMHRIGGQNEHVTTGMRNAGLFSVDAMQDVVDLHNALWKTGTVATHTTSISLATNVNPSFAFASHLEGFVAHYGTSPVTAFPIASAYANLSTDVKSAPPTTDNLVATMQLQFREWCAAFCRSLKKNRNIVIRIVVGDVLATCRTLHHLSGPFNAGLTADLPIKAWQASPLAFDGGDYAHCDVGAGAPLSFNVIDTSNLSDHLGVLNLLLVTTPLLKRTPFSTLNTETLLPLGKDPTRSFTSRLCGDIATMSTMLDILPVSFVSGFATRSNVHELVSAACSDRLGVKQFHERLVWKIPSLMGPSSDGGSIKTDSLPLARFLMSVYHQMFAQENMQSMLLNLGDITDALDRSAVHYSRESFALFIHHLQNRIDADWNQVMESLLSMIASDTRLLVGLNYYQELLCHLHMLGIYSEQPFIPGNSLLIESGRRGRLRGWKEIPPVVCIVLPVPRYKLRCLDDTNMPGNPFLTIDLVSMSANFHNSFSPMRVAFGSAVRDGNGEDTKVYITEDPRGKEGGSSVVVSFWAPTWVLAVAPEETSVQLCVKSTPLHAQFTKKLGIMLTIYSAPLKDTHSVHVARSLPIVRGTSHIAAVGPIHHPVRRNARMRTMGTARAQFDDSGHVLQALSIRQDVQGEVKKELAQPSTDVKVHSRGSCTIDLHVGLKIVKGLSYPSLVDASRAKIRIARKSGWVEVIAPMCGAAGLRPNKFIVVGETGSLASWNFHRIHLERMPALDMNRKDDFEWLRQHAIWTVSDKERDMVNTSCKDTPAIVHVKRSIISMLHKAVGIDGKKSRIFGLHKASGGGIATLLFIEDLRLDLASHTVVADGYVLPLNNLSAAHLLDKLSALHHGADLAQFSCEDEEIIEWAYLIPALVERCRDWSHKSDCDYVRRGVIPLSVSHTEIPICGCGRGKVSPNFHKYEGWAPFAPYVTRIAMSPLFAVSYVDPVCQDIAKKLSRMELGGNSPSSQTILAQPTRCAHCNTIFAEKILTCSRCKKAPYCGRSCQAADWKQHKKTCVKA